MDTEGKYIYKYPHPAVTTDCVIFGYDGEGLKILLIERGGEPCKGKWAFPGGFLNMDETAEEGAARELMEETGMESDVLEQFHSYTDPNRDPRERIITIAYYALCKMQNVVAGDDAAKARWFKLDEIPELAFDHDMLLKHALNALKMRAYFYPIGMDIMEENFKLEELRRLYETVVGKRLENETLGKRLTEAGLIIPVDGKGLYTFDKERYKEVKQNGMHINL